MGIQARSRRNRSAVSNALFILFLFAAGIAAGLWVSLRYLNDPIAEHEFPRPAMPRRLDRIVVVPTWLDHPYMREENPYLSDFQYRGPKFDLNRLFFGSAVAAIPPGSSFASDYQSRRALGLVNADGERIYHERFEEESRAAIDRLGRVQGRRALDEVGEGLSDERKRMDPDTLRALRVPGAVLYFAASAATGRAVRARVGPGTVVRTQALSREDYRLQIDHQVAAIGLTLGSGYDSVDARRSLSVTQSIGGGWAVGVDRTVSNVEDRRESAMRVLFAAPF